MLWLLHRCHGFDSQARAALVALLSQVCWTCLSSTPSSTRFNKKSLFLTLGPCAHTAAVLILGCVMPNNPEAYVPTHRDQNVLDPGDRLPIAAAHGYVHMIHIKNRLVVVWEVRLPSESLNLSWIIFSHDMLI